MATYKNSLIQAGAIFAAVALGAALVGSLAHRNALAEQEETHRIMSLDSLDPNVMISVPAGEVYCKTAVGLGRTHGANPGTQAEIVRSSETRSVDHNGQTVRVDCSQYTPG